MTGQLYIGRPTFDPRPYTRLNPLARAEHGGWRVQEDWREIFPREGRVFAPRLPGFQSGQLVVFSVETNQRGDAGQDQFIVRSAEPALEVLDFRDVDPELARRALVERGLDRALPPAQKIVVALRDGLCVELRMVRHPTLDRWVADIDGLDEVQTCTFDTRLFDGDQVDGRWIRVPGATVGTGVGVVNWCRDADFLEAVVKRLRKLVPQGNPGIPRAQIPHLIRDLLRADLLPSASSDLDPYLTRLKAFVPALSVNLERATELAELVGSLPPVSERLNVIAADRRKELDEQIRCEIRTEIEEDIRREMQSLQSERDRLASEVANLASLVTDSLEEKARAEAATASAREVMVEEFSVVLRTLGDVASSDDQTVQQLATRLSSRLGTHGALIQMIAQPAPPWVVSPVANLPASDWATYHESLNASAQGYGFTLMDVLLADTAARAGELVVVPEDRSDLIACYADAISAGDMSRHVLDPTTMGLDDLWFRPGDHRPTAFARAWTHASFDPSRFCIVLLDGLHRTPMDLWMPSLVDILWEQRRPSNLLVFASLGPNFIDPARLWDDLEHAVVPVAPETPSGLTTRVLARASRRELPRTCFDPRSAPSPGRAEVADHLGDWEARCDARSLERIAAEFRAAWPLRDVADGTSRAATLAGVPAFDHATGPAAAIRRGADWLRRTLQDRG